MKRNFNKFLLTSIGVLSLTAMPMYANAAEFSFGSATKEDHVTKIPVVIEIGEEEKITQAKFGCELNTTEATCKIEANTGDGVLGTDTNSSTTFTYYLNEETVFPSGNTTIATLVITNNTTARLNDVKVTLKNASIENVSKEESISTSLNPKKEEKPLSTDARFSNIKFSQGTMYPTFSPDVTEYTVYNIADTINSVKITHTCNEGQCDFNISGGKSISGNAVTLNQGENIIKYTGTSEDGLNQLTYTFTVIRGETTFNSPKLKTLSFGDYTLTPVFNADVKEYTVMVPNNVTDLKDVMQYTAMDDKANVKVTGLENLVIGENIVTITIDNLIGDETYTYKVVVTRMNEQDIEVLKYIDSKVTYRDSDGIQNTLSINDFKEQYPDEYEKINDGTYEFDEDGNIIIEGQEEEKKEEEPKEEKKNSKTWLIVVLIIVGLVIIVVSGIFIFKKKKPNKNDDTKNKKENEETQNEDQEEEIDEEGIEEKAIGSEFAKDMDTTVDIDEALSDLMSTKQYEFKDEEGDK